MTPEQLKASILQYAIQGKLVEQRLEEGDAEELYQQIQEEKQKLIKEGKIKKEKTLAEITEDDIPFDIPESWKWCYVGDLFLHNTGKAQNASGSQNGVIRKFITTSNLYWNEFDFTKVKEMPFTNQELERCTVKKGDLLVCEGGDCGRSAVWNYDEEVCIQNHVHRLRPYKEIDIYFFYYIFYLYKNTGRLRGRGVAIQGLSNEAIHKVIIPLPPLEEQHRIVAKIEELLPYVDRYAASYEKLEQFNAKFPEEMKKSILQYTIQGKLVEQRPEEGTVEELYQQIQEEKQTLIKEGKVKKEKPLAEITEDEIPFDIPESWKWVRLGNVINECFQGINTAGNHVKFVQDDGVPIIQTGDMSKGVVDLSSTKIMSWEDYEIYKDKYQPRYNDIFYCNIGTIGKPLIYREKHIMLFHWNIFVIRVNEKYIVPEYMKIYLEYVTDYFKANTDGTAMQFVSKKKITNVLFPLPPIEEQHRIVDKIEELLPYCDQLIK